MRYIPITIKKKFLTWGVNSVNLANSRKKIMENSVDFSTTMHPLNKVHQLYAEYLEKYVK